MRRKGDCHGDGSWCWRGGGGGIGGVRRKNGKRRNPNSNLWSWMVGAGRSSGTPGLLPIARVLSLGLPLSLYTLYTFSNMCTHKHTEQLKDFTRICMGAGIVSVCVYACACMCVCMYCQETYLAAWQRLNSEWFSSCYGFSKHINRKKYFF